MSKNVFANGREDLGEEGRQQSLARHAGRLPVAAVAACRADPHPLPQLLQGGRTRARAPSRSRSAGARSG